MATLRQTSSERRLRDADSSGFILRVMSSNTVPIEAPPEYTARD
jgi:hypothetical protein